jgi:phosphonate transport system permease protein
MTGSNSSPSEALTLAVAPASDHPGGLELRGLVSYLSERTGVSINLRQCKDYKEAMTSLTDGSAQIGWLGSFAYKEAAGRNGSIEAFAVGVPKGKSVPNYHSLFIVRPDSDIRMLADVRNSYIALGDVFSTSGHDVPRRELAEVGIDIDNEGTFKSITHVANHDEAIRAVLDGRVDVAPVSSVNLEEMVASGTIDPSSFRIVHQSPDIPGAPLVCTRDLEPALKQQIKALVLDAHNHIDVSGYGGLLERYVDPVDGHRKHLETYLRPQWGWRALTGIAAFVAIYGAIMVDLEVDPAQLISDSFAYFSDVLGRMLPPDFSNFGQLMLSMLETVEIAMLGTLLAILLSIPIGLFSARNISPNYPLYLVARTITVFFRAIPEFIMAMILVIAIGFGAMPGVIALGFHTMGFLAKFYAEAIEHINEGPMQALDSMGASRRQVLAFAVAPQIMPSFMGNNLYILDRNIRMATMLGIVGAGGIGYELQSAFRMFEYERVSAIIIVIFVTIFAIDMISSYIRSKVA